MTESPDALIVGAGAVGLACAYELARHGANVVVLDAAPRAGTGASMTNAGLLVPSHVDPLPSWGNIRAGLASMVSREGPFQLEPYGSLAPWMARFVYHAGGERHRRAANHLRTLARQSFAMHKAYFDSGLATGYSQSGMIDIFHRRSSFERAATVQRNRTDCAVLTAAEVHDFLPACQASGAVGGVRFEQEGFCDSTSLCTALVRECESLGVRFIYGAHVTRLRQHREAVTGADTLDATYTSRHVVLAAGSWSRKIAATAGINVPLEPGTGYILDFDSVEGDPTMPVAFADHRMVVTPYPDRLRVTGMMLLTGPRPSIDHRRVGALRGEASRMIPSLMHRRPRKVQIGQRPCTPDGLPVIGPSERRTGLIMATGHGQSGIILAPITGRLVHSYIADSAPGEHAQACVPDRFSSMRTQVGTLCSSSTAAASGSRH